jgi:FHS family L-fucose permease-like MFS transporter
LQSSATTAATDDFAPSQQRRRLLALMMGLFFAFGFCTVLVDTLIPKLKGMFQLSYTEVMLTQFCFFLAYFVISGPAGWLIGRIGYLRAIVVGLVVMAAGCALFTPAADIGSYPAFLGALFILASGVTTVQVAANPLTSLLGPPASASSRLTLAQAFNSVATMIGPQFGAALILAHSHVLPDPKTLTASALAGLRAREAQSVQGPFLMIAAALILLALLCWTLRRWTRPAAQASGGFIHLLGNRRLVLGALSIFAYVGAEVSIGSSIANFLMMKHTLGLSMRDAGSLISVYWGLAMVGRFAGSWLLGKLPAGRVLMGCALGAGLLAVIAGSSSGLIAAAAVLSVGLFNSIQFPTIFTLAIEGLGEDTPGGSGLLCLAIVGGAVVPLATGFAADHLGLGLALLVPAVCYVWIACYGLITSGSLRSAASGLAIPASPPA